MIERVAIRSAQFRKAAALLCLLAGGRIVFAQTADPGATNPPAPPADVRPEYVPITQQQRFHTYIHSFYSPMSLATGAVSAAWGQYRDRPKEWPQGLNGYATRYGSGYAQRIVRETLTFGASSLLHEDNRYFKSTETSNGRRIKYAVISTLTARKEDGSTRFSYSRIGGMFGASLISRTWQPVSTGSMKSAYLNFSTSLAFAAGFNVLREFMPKRLRFGK